MKRRVSGLFVALALLLALQALPASMSATSNVPSQAVGLGLTIIPPKLPTNGTYPAVVVSLVDSNGLPSAASSDLTVYLSSSQANIASVPNAVTLKAGSEYVVVNATTTATPGSTTITASSHGLQSKFTTLTTAIPSGFPSKLEVFISPSSILPSSLLGARAYNGSIRVELVDDAGFPSKAITPVTALLFSSNVSIASLDQNSLTINPGKIYATGDFTTQSGSGQAVITASSTGFGSGEAIVTVVPPDYCKSSCRPSEVLLNLVPGTLPADGNTYSALEIGLATSSGQPAVSSLITIVQLSSENPSVVSVPGIVMIPAGSISVLADLTTSSLQGHSSITAVSSSLLPGNASVTTLIPAPSNLQEYVAPPSTFVTSAGSPPILVIQLQDSNGNPARARAVTSIVVTSSNSSLVSGPLHLSIGVGADYVLTHLAASGSGQSVLTASSEGLSSSQVNLQLARSPLVDQLSVYIPKGTLYSNGTATMTLSVAFLGQPVPNITVHWTATGGYDSPLNTTTGASGSTSTTFTPDVDGPANVTASTSSPLTGPISLSRALYVYQLPVSAKPTLLHTIMGYWYYIVAAVAVVVVGLAYTLRMRGKKQKAEIEAGFEVV